MALEEIRSPKQLLVEGKSGVSFFNALIRHLGLADVQIQDFGGKDDLRGFLNAFSLAPGFAAGVKSLGIVRDAESDARAARQSVLDSLAAARLPCPAQAEVFAGDRPKVGVLILPDACAPGMLETLCIQSVSGDPVWPCVEDYLRCVAEKAGHAPKPLDKARIQAFLASRERPGLLLGHAAQMGCFPWDNPAFERVKTFLRQM